MRGREVQASHSLRKSVIYYSFRSATCIAAPTCRSQKTRRNSATEWSRQMMRLRRSLEIEIETAVLSLRREIANRANAPHDAIARASHSSVA
jgi:hypothetical protein